MVSGLGIGFGILHELGTRLGWKLGLLLDTEQSLLDRLLDGRGVVEAMTVGCDLRIHLGIQKDDSWSADSEFGVTSKKDSGGRTVKSAILVYDDGIGRKREVDRLRG